ncbi:hypothetical protein ACOMHN_009668 [Nucella lapillus]
MVVRLGRNPSLGGNWWVSSAPGPVVSGISCSSDKTHLDNCTRDDLGSRLCRGGLNSRASVICFDIPMDRVDTGFAARLVSSSGAKTSDGWGRLQVRYKGYWGDVCPDIFTRNESNVACRTLGYSGGVVHGYQTAFRMNWDHSWSPKDTMALAPVWLNSFSCMGTETSLEDCDIRQWGAPNVVSCKQSSYLICYNTELKVTIDNSNKHYGILSVVRDSQSGKICGHNFEDYDAGVACKTMGYYGGKVLKSELDSAVNGPAYLSDVKCNRGDSNLFQCDSMWKDSSVTCSSNTQQAAVSCFYDVDLRFGTNHRSGMVVIYDKDTHSFPGKICSTTFSDTDARVVCQHIGFADGLALPAGVYGQDGLSFSTVNTQLTGLQCIGNETKVWQCPLNNTDSISCLSRTSNYASVSCFNSKIQNDKYKLEMGPTGGSQLAGQVNIFYKQTWGFVCPTYWTDQAASVLCKHLGKQGGMSFYYPGQYSGPYFVTGVSCVGSELALSACTSMTQVCEDSAAAGVLCYNNAAPKVTLIDEGSPTRRRKRSVGDNVAWRGRVNIQVDGEDGRVCGDKWSDSNAAVVCKGLGYRLGIAVTYPRSSKQVVMFEVGCSGRESSLFRCVNKGWRSRPSSSCSGPQHTEAGVACFHDVKLTAGKSTAQSLSGDLQIIHPSNQNFWSPVCSSGITPAVAKVACKEIGFSTGVVVGSTRSFLGFVVGYSLTCSGNETKVANCSTRAYACSENARVMCYNTGGDAGWQWTIQNGIHGEVRVTRYGIQGSVCKDGWNDTAANALCQDKGFKGGVAFGLAAKRTNPTELMWLKAVRCPAGAGGMDECSVETSPPADCWDTNAKAAAVLCYRISAPKLSLADGSNKYEGRVQIEYDGVNGTICDIGWGSNDAVQLCMSLGYETGNIRSVFPGGSGTIYLSNVLCDLPGKGQKGNLLTCPSDGWSVRDPLCQNHRRDAGAVCHPAVKLGDNSVGPVQVLVDYAFRLVCGSRFDNNAAKVVCRQLGFAAGKALYPGAFGRQRESIAITNVKCTGSETKFKQCNMNRGNAGACNSSYASAVCSNEDSPAYSVKLTNWDYGYVKVEHYDHEGYICANGFDDQDVQVLCKEAGFLTGFAYNNYLPTSENDIIWLDNLNCTGGESRLDQCRQGNNRLDFGHYPAEAGCPKASVFCANSYNKITLDMRLTEDGKTGSRKGRVEVKINGTWGAICAEGFGEAEASVVCRQLGYMTGRNLDEIFPLGNGILAWVIDTNCTGKEQKALDCQMTLANHTARCFKNAAASCNSGVRLNQDVPGAVPNHGIAQVMKKSGSVSKWVAVCSEAFTNHTAQLFCKEIDYASGYYHSYTADYFERLYYGAANITCSAQDSMYSQCSLSESESEVCPEAGYVYLFCSRQNSPAENLQVTRVIGGPVKVSRYGFIGAVCGDNFTDTEAKIVCKQNYTNGIALKSYSGGSFSMPVVMSKLKCTGKEAKLTECMRSSFVTSGSDCQNGSAASVLCTTSTEPIKFRVYPEGAKNGRAELYVNNNWMLVDGIGFTDDEAKVFCKSAGFYTGERGYGSYYSSPRRQYFVSRVRCTGSEDSLLQCVGDWSLSSNARYVDAYVRCSLSVRTVRGSSDANGMLQFYSGLSWGSVCSEGFDDKDALVACRELGYDHGVHYSCCMPHGRTFSFGLAKVNCSGKESTFADCPASTAYTDIATCLSYQYASIACFNTNDTTNYAISLVGKEGNTGPVNLTYVGTEGRICSDNWDDVDARVVCRELGYPDGQAYLHYRSTWFRNAYSGPFWASNFTCSGSESRLQDCPHTGVGQVTECVKEHMAGALCFQDSGIAFRLVGNTTNYGRVEIYYNGTWGTICSNSMNMPAARVFCRSQGFTDGVVRKLPKNISQATGPVFRTYLYCQGTEEDLNRCAREGWQGVGENEYYCQDDHTTDAGVYCFDNVRKTTDIEVIHGAVRLNYNNSWTYFNDNGFDDQTAGDVCDELGYEDGRAVCCSAYMGSPQYLWTGFSDDLYLHCTGEERSLDECVRTGEGLSGLYASVICKKPGAPFNDTVYTFDFGDSNAEDTGPVEVQYLGVKGRICALDWDDQDATVFCKTKGYGSGLAYTHSNKHDYKTHLAIGPYLMSGFECKGNETDLMDCPHNDRLSMGNCSSGHSAGVACYNNAGVKYRLVNGTESRGRVEMSLDGEWGTVCNDEWDDKDAQVFCRSMNFTDGVARPVSEFGQGTGTMWLTDVQCQGTEAAIHQCPHSGFSEELKDTGWWDWFSVCADHSDDAAVYCYKNVRLTRLKSDMGGLQVYHKGQWVSVCDHTFDDNAATAACRGLDKGWNYGLAIKGSAFDPMDIPMKIQSIQCKQNESDIVDCDIQDMGSCPSGHYASVACSEEPFKDEGFKVRITNDSLSSEAWGIVEVSKKGLWRKICHQGWNGKDADVVCRQIGYKGGVSYTHIINHIRPIGYRNFTCTGTETTLDQCHYESTPDLEDCAYSDYDAGVVCYNSTGVSYALGGGNGTAGRVEIHYDGEVGAVCSHYWAFNDSRVFCRSLGFHDGLPISRPNSEDTPPRLYNMLINAPFCMGNEPFLLDCLTSGFNTSYMSYVCYGEAFVQCYNITLEITKTRLMLADGTVGTDEGRLEVYLSGPDIWGTVCDDYWDDFDASVACVQHGYLWGVAITNLTYGQGEGQIWLDNVECSGTEKNVGDCIHRGFGTHNCWHWEDAGVKCYNTPKPTLPPTTTVATIPTTTPLRSTPSSPPTTTAIPTKPPVPTTTKPTTPHTTTPATPSTYTTTTTTTTTTTRPLVVGGKDEQKDTLPIAVGVTIPLLVIIVLVVIVAVVIIKRRHRKNNIPHQRFSDDVISGSTDGSISMSNQMYDSNLDDGTKRMTSGGEITLGGDRAVYVPEQPPTNGVSAESGFANPLYSVMQPFRTEAAQLPDQKGDDSNEA